MAATAVAVSAIAFSARDTLAWYEWSPGVAYGFCSNCGSSLFWRSADRPEHLSITAGTVDRPTGLRTEVALFTAEHGDYHTPEPVDASFPGDRG